MQKENRCSNKNEQNRKSLVHHRCWRISILGLFQTNINTKFTRTVELWNIADMPCIVIITYFFWKYKPLNRHFIGKICKIISFYMENWIIRNYWAVPKRKGTWFWFTDSSVRIWPAQLYPHQATLHWCRIECPDEA